MDTQEQTGVSRWPRVADALGAASEQEKLCPSRTGCLSRVPKNLGTIRSNF